VFRPIRVANVTTSFVHAISTTPLSSTPLKVLPNATIIVEEILVHNAEPFLHHGEVVRRDGI
jgi:hypothetical protein